eukprot:jgi/Galph1/3062/GphlegSOOS_G1731.1
MSTCSSIGASNYSYGGHIAALFTILATSLIGISLPIVSKRYPRVRLPFIVMEAGRAFGTGVVIATGFVHMIPPAITNLSNDCLPFFFTNTYNSLGAAIALAAALSIQLLELISAIWIQRLSSTNQQVQQQYSVQSLEERQDGQAVYLSADEEKETTIATAKGRKLKMLVVIFELGVALHSVIIGLNLGVSSGATYRSLFAALVFHQFFEGFAIGTTVAEAAFSIPLTMVMICAYVLETPLGVAIGMGIVHSYQENSVASLVTRGVLDGISGGILIYTGLVELLTYWFTRNPKFVGQQLWRIVIVVSFVWLGAICMSIIGAWA